MTIADKAKLILLEQWCWEHDKPGVYEDLCKDCFNPIDPRVLKAIDLAFIAHWIKTARNLKKIFEEINESKGENKI